MVYLELTIARLLRIDTLIFELKTRIDDDEIAVRAGVELSYLTQSGTRNN